MSNRLSVVIAGHTFRLVADENVEYMRKIARIADEKVRDACAAAGGNSFSAGVLAVLNIADETVKTAAERDELLARLERTDAIEAELKETQERCIMLEQKLTATERALTATQAQCAALAAQRTVAEDKLQDAEEELVQLEDSSAEQADAPPVELTIKKAEPPRRGRRRK